MNKRNFLTLFGLFALSKTLFGAGSKTSSNPTISEDRGDSDITLAVGDDTRIQIITAALTANRVISLSTVGANHGDTFCIIRQGLGLFTLTVKVGATTLKVIPSVTPATIDVVFVNGTWILQRYSVL